MCCDHLLGGVFYDPAELFNFEQIVSHYIHLYGVILKDYIVDTDSLIQEALRAGKNILVEGAQGDLLSVDYGTYPFVTSSDASLEGLVKGCGLKTEDVDLDLGIIKGFIQTRVGSGPFPTEAGGAMSAVHCDIYTKEYEEKYYPKVDINSNSDFDVGMALRRVAQEYGATTGRPRRIGYLDLALLKHSLRRSSKKTRLVLTKLDVLSGMNTIKVCTHYVYQGEPYFDGKTAYVQGSTVECPSMDHIS